jgi:hypothetical protein
MLPKTDATQKSIRQLKGAHEALITPRARGGDTQRLASWGRRLDAGDRVNGLGEAVVSMT